MKNAPVYLSFFVAFLVSCETKQAKESKEQKDTAHKIMVAPKPKEIKTTTFHYADTKQWLLDHKKNELALQLAYAINRTDRANFMRMDSVIVPLDSNSTLVQCLPFPLKVPYLKDIAKIVYFSYPAQVFATYEHGKLMHTGPTNMGRKSHLTATGLFFTNWKAKKSISTVNDEWILYWNFNIMNKEGVGWHQYSLPGYPASHSCLRLQEKDALYLYNWADQWVLNMDTIQVKGTPVIVFGKYDFESPKPWLKLVSHPHFLDISVDSIQSATKPFLPEIIAAQKNRALFESNKL